MPGLRNVPAAGGAHHIWGASGRAADHGAGGCWPGQCVTGWDAVLGMCCDAPALWQGSTQCCSAAQLPTWGLDGGWSTVASLALTDALPPSGLQSRLAEASQPKTRTKLAQLLQHAARGVLGNPTGGCNAPAPGVLVIETQ